MTDSPSEADVTPEAEDADAPAEGAAADELADFAAALAVAVGAESHSADFGNVKVRVSPERWLEAVTRARDFGLDFFSFLSATDWSNDVQVGDPVAEPDSLEERIELLCRLSTVVDDRGAVLSTDLPHDEPVIDSLVPIFGGAAWHEREAHEMFGIDFRGHPNLVKLYLPDAFEGNPLRKSYPLLSREVKPWPGLVDVEGMPGDGDGDGDEEAAE